MTSDILRDRVWSPTTLPEMQVRNHVLPDGTEGRTVVGMAVPFDQPTRIREMQRGRLVEYDEVFRRGAFAETIAERGDRVKLLINHQRENLPVGRALSLREEPSGLVAEFFVPDSSEGNDLLSKIRGGAVDSFSIGFVPQPDGTVGDPGAGGLVERTAVKLLEVSAVGFGAYDGAQIVGVRNEDPEDPADHGAAPDQGDKPDQLARARAIALLDLDNYLREVIR